MFACVVSFACAVFCLFSLWNLSWFVCLSRLYSLNAFKGLLETFICKTRIIYRVCVFSVLNRCLLCFCCSRVLRVRVFRVLLFSYDIALYPLNTFKRPTDAFIS